MAANAGGILTMMSRNSGITEIFASAEQRSTSSAYRNAQIFSQRKSKSRPRSINMTAPKSVEKSKTNKNNSICGTSGNNVKYHHQKS